MTLLGLSCVAFSVMYVLALSIYAWKIDYRSRGFEYLGVILAWLIPPFYWHKTASQFCSRFSAEYMAVAMTASIIFSLYSIILISGMLGVHSRLSFTIAAVLWFALPANITLAFFSSKLNTRAK